MAGVLPTCPPIWLCTAERVGPVESNIPGYLFKVPRGNTNRVWAGGRRCGASAVPRPQCLAVRCRAATVLDAALGTIEKLSVLLTKKGRQCFSQWQITVISIVFTIGIGHGIVKNSSCVLSTELFWGIVFYIMCGILLCLGITVSGMYLHHMNLIL